MTLKAPRKCYIPRTCLELDFDHSFHRRAIKSRIPAHIFNEKGTEKASSPKSERNVERETGENQNGLGAAAGAETENVQHDESAGTAGSPGPDQNRGPRQRADVEASKVLT